MLARTSVVGASLLFVLAACGGAAVPANATADESDGPPSYEVFLKPGAASYTVGQPGTVQAVLVAKNGFKCNDKYPHKFETTPGDGVTFPSPTLRDVQLEGAKATIEVGLVPVRAGKVTVAGTYHFSVCSEAVCQIKKEPLTVDLEVTESTP